MLGLINFHDSQLIWHYVVIESLDFQKLCYTVTQMIKEQLWLFLSIFREEFEVHFMNNHGSLNKC